MSAKKLFEEWSENYPNASKESARKVWALYNDTVTDEEKLDASFKELNYRPKGADVAVEEQTGAPKGQAPSVK